MNARDPSANAPPADFGYSIPLSAPHTNIVGTPYWMAPEVIKDKQYTANADIWALGIVLIEMIDRAPPYVDEEPIKALSLIVENGVPAVRASYRLSAGVKDFLAQCLVVDVSRRASAEELLQASRARRPA
jgi:serine/threonine protein kinase